MKKILIFFCMFFMFPPVYAQPYQMMIGPAPGFLSEDGKGPGDILYRKVLEHLKKKGIEVEVQFVPWKRADTMFNTHKADIEFPALLGDSALENAVFSAPISKLGMVIFTKSDQPRLNSIHELKGNVGVVLGFTYPKELDSQPDIRLITNRDIETTLQALSNERLRAVIHWGAASFAAQKKVGLTDIHCGKEFTLSFGCFAAHMNPEGIKIISEINQAIGEMMVQGEYQKIMKGSYRSLLPSE